jgi:hypothetical protein
VLEKPDWGACSQSGSAALVLGPFGLINGAHPFPTAGGINEKAT